MKMDTMHIEPMKRDFYYLAVLTLCFAACNKQEVTPVEEGILQEEPLTTVTIKATNGDADTKAAVSDALAFTWSAGDKIAVHTDNETYFTSDGLVSGGSASADFTVSYSGTRNGFAVYPAACAKTWDGSNLTLSLPASYTLSEVSGEVSPLPMIAQDGGADLSFKHVASLLRLTVKDIPADATGLVIEFVGHKVNGEFTIASPAAGTSTISTSTSYSTGEDKIAITGIGTETEVTVNIPLPVGDYDDIYITPSGSTTKVAAVRHIKAGGYPAARAYGRKLTATLVSFSVADSKKVVFAPGNLQAAYDGSGWTWAFAATQSSYIGEAAGNTKVTASSPFISENATVDLFGWVGTSSIWTGAAMYGINSSTTKDSSETYGNGTGEALKSDWGANVIGSYLANVWRTLTIDEWTYLIETRTVNGGKGSGHSYTLKKNGDLGIVLYPDNYTGSTYNSDADWSPFESAGCVFLPTAGYREGTAVYFGGTQGHYWSSSPNSINANSAYVLSFDISKVTLPPSRVSRAYGNSVRLVRDL